MVGDNDLCFSVGVIDLHSVGTEASCYNFPGFSNLGKKLVGGVGDDGDCEVIEKGRDW